MRIWVLLVAISGCGGTQEPASSPSTAPEPAAEGQRVEHGRATYYADSLAGNRTASGERYDPRAMTAAHRTLPFGSVVRVIRSDGRFVEVTINDRGPFGGHGAVIDLSRTAAEKLGMLRAGVVDVELEVVYLAPERRRRR